MSYVNFISDNSFRLIVQELLDCGKQAKLKTANDLGRNTIDPFSIIWEMAAFDSSFEEWHQSEISRQTQKTLANHIGMFHQKILGSVTGWEDLQVGNMVDLVNNERKIVAEIKNKHNTVTGGKLVDVYKELESLVMPNGQKYKGYTSYYVEIIPKRPQRYNEPFTPSDKKTSKRCPKNEQIRRIDGASFYTLVTGEDNALQQVFESIPRVIKDVSKDKTISNYDRAIEYFNRAYLS